MQILQYRGLGLYLLAWTPLAGLQVLLLSAGGMGWFQALAVGLPLAYVYAFPCLSAWYLSRTHPLDGGRILRWLLTFSGAALLTSSYWIFVGRLWSSLLDELTPLQGTAALYRGQQLPLFIVGVFLFGLVTAAAYLIGALEKSRQSDREALEMRLLAQQAELQALKYRINPHFLFNSLNSVSALTRSDPAKARRMCLLLAGFLRKSLKRGAEETIPLGDEVELTGEYLSIEKIRRPDLDFSLGIDSRALAVPVPALILQPLVENAVKHGISQLLKGGTVTVVGELHEGRLYLCIENPYDPEATRPGGTGLGLKAVEKRLQLTSGEKASLRVRRRDGVFRVEMTLPAGDAVVAPQKEPVRSRW
ncbi:MAG TPA: histidine kinase [Acidobacteriota bacterium]|nr:histidine kinase [Acidobacteriota bacterium]